MKSSVFKHFTVKNNCYYLSKLLRVSHIIVTSNNKIEKLLELHVTHPVTHNLLQYYVYIINLSFKT